MANYIIIGGDNVEYGPVDEAGMREWIAEGRLNAASRVKAESDAEFRVLALFPEFASLLKQQSTPGIIAPPATDAVMDDSNWEAEVLARAPELRLGECLSFGWSFLGANIGFMLGAVLMTWAVNLFFVIVSIEVPIIGPMLLLCVNGVIMGGFYLACLRRSRGEAVPPTAVFNGFKIAFVQLMLTSLVGGLLTGLACCFLLLPCIYLMVAWFLALPLAADRKLFFWAAMELSRKVVTRVWFEMFALLLIAFLPMLLFQVVNMFESGKFCLDIYNQAGQNLQQAALAFKSQAPELEKLTLHMTLFGQGVMLLNLFYSAGVIIRAYENLFGPGKPR